MIHRAETTVSTNLDARAGRPGDVFTAEFQTAGRGRLDHAWESAMSKNLMFSMVLACGDQPPGEVATLPLVVGLAVARALEGEGVCVGLKWPNDVLAEGRKLCGILCERSGENVIAGVGVNVNQSSFAGAIAERATSLLLLTGRRFDREEVLQRLIASINRYHARWLEGGFASVREEYGTLDCLRGRVVSVRATDADVRPVTGLCGGVGGDGALLVGDVRVYAGEAHVEGVLG